MPYKLVKNMLPTSKYPLKAPLTRTPTRIVVHNTANDATARNEISYMKNNSTSTGYHYAIDDKEVVQCIPESRSGHHAGDGTNGSGNKYGIGIEICYSKSGGAKFIAAEKNAAKFITARLKHYGWGVEKVTKHQDYSGKYCPHRTLDMGWSRFINMVKQEMEVENMTSLKDIKDYVRVHLKREPNKTEVGFVGKHFRTFFDYLITKIKAGYTSEAAKLKAENERLESVNSDLKSTNDNLVKNNEDLAKALKEAQKESYPDYVPLWLRSLVEKLFKK